MLSLLLEFFGGAILIGKIDRGIIVHIFASFARTISFLLTALILGGCAMPITLVSQRPLREELHYVKNYSIGQPMKVSVGESMIKVQNYWVELTEARVAIPDRTTTVTHGLVEGILESGKKYPVRGFVSLDNVEYTLVGVPVGTLSADSYVAGTVLVRSDGSLHNQFGFVSGTEFSRGLYTAIYSDPLTRLIRDTVQNIKTSKGYENFEILYAGKNANGLNLTYREFSPEGVARTAFFQNLTYEADAKSISFKKFRISIEKATSEEIFFYVLADGYD